MKYEKIYIDLINNARQKTYTGYCENHHIIPKSIGGSDEVGNLVLLSAREHFVAHQLLVKIFPKNDKLVYAARLCMSTQLYPNKFKNWIAIKYSKLISQRNVEMHTKERLISSTYSAEDLMNRRESKKLDATNKLTAKQLIARERKKHERENNKEANKIRQLAHKREKSKYAYYKQKLIATGVEIDDTLTLEELLALLPPKSNKPMTAAERMVKHRAKKRANSIIT